MKKTFITLLAAAITLSAAAQQTNTTQAPDTTHHYQHVHKGHKGFGNMQSLNLTQDQKNQLKALNKSYHEQLTALYKNENITVKEQRDQAYALRKEQRTKVQSILTDEQKAQLQQLKAQQAEQRLQIAAKHLDKLKTTLNLSDDQVAQLKAQRAATAAKIKAIMQDDSLTREQKHEQFSAVRKDSKESFRKILTADQLSKLEQMKKTRMERNNS